MAQMTTNNLFEDRAQTTKSTSCVVRHYSKANNMAGSRHLENRRDVIFRQWMSRFGRNSAAGCRI